jgi:hypothetical protein
MSLTVQECPNKVSKVYHSGRVTYIGANFGSCIPHSNHLDVSCNESLTLTLLPVHNKAGIPVARD